MSVADNIAVARRHLDALSRGDIDAAVACYAPEARNHGHPATHASIRRVLESLHMVRERQTIEEVIAVDDKVVCRTTCHGVHAAMPAHPGINGGVLSGVAPTGREYTVQHIHIFQIEGGQIVAHWANRDDLGMAKQLGFVLTPPQ